MTSKIMQEKLTMYDEFRNKYWPVSNVANISLDDYTNLRGDSFTYDVETWTRKLGSNKQEAFEGVKKAVNDVIVNAQNSNFTAIDNNPLDSMFK